MKQYLLIGAALMALSVPTQAENLKLCTGGKAGKYFAVGNMLQQSLAGKVDVQVFESAGSDANLRRMENASAPDGCDAALVQNDAIVWYNRTYRGNALKVERVQAMYPEYVHLICNKDSGISKIKDFYGTKNKKIAIGKPGSGTQITWSNFVASEKRYETITTIDQDGTLAINKVKANDTSCFMFTAGLKTGVINRINDENTGELFLANLNDGDLTDAKDEKNRPIYRWQSIPGGTYKNLQTGFFSTSTETVAQDSILVVNTAWAEKNERAYTDLTSAAARIAKQLQ